MATYRINASLKKTKIQISSSPSSLSVEDLFSFTPILIFAALVGALQFKPCPPLCALEVALGTWFDITGLGRHFGCTQVFHTPASGGEIMAC